MAVTKHSAIAYTEAHAPANHNHTASGDGGTLTAPELVNYIQATAITAPGTPAAGKARLFIRSSDKLLCWIDDAGLVHPAVDFGTTRTANTLLGGPTSGGAAAATFRALVAADLPAATVTAVGAVQSGFLFAATANKTVANTTTETSLLGTGVGTTTLPANCLTAGRSLRVKMSGYVMEDGGFPAAVNVRVKLGGVTLSNMTLDPGASAASVETNLHWELEATITCRTTGAGGTIMEQARVLFSQENSSSIFEGVFMAYDTNTSTAACDTTGTLLADVTAEWGSIGSDNSITCTNCTIELIG